jgi:thiol-disulfide isomerase/thioredoxin
VHWRPASVPFVLVAVSLSSGAAGCGGSETKPEPAFEQRAPTPPAPDPAAEDPPEDPREQVYREAMDAMADDIIAKTKAGAATDFQTYAEAKAALEAALPQQSLSKIDEALIDASISTEDMAAFMRENPEFVQQVGARFSERLAEVEPQLAQLIAKVAALAPPGEREQVKAMLDGLGYGSLLEAPAWTEVGAASELREVAAAAAEQHRALLLDVRAQWCLPCKELEEKTLADAEVAGLLGRSFATAKFDVTDPDESIERLQKSLGVTTLPALLIWKDPSKLALALEGGAKADEAGLAPDVEIRVFLEPPELLPKLREVAGAESSAP